MTMFQSNTQKLLRMACALCTLTLLTISPAAVSAQPAPPQVVQTSDGTLYLVQNGSAWTLVPNQIDDADLSRLNQSGELDGTIPDQFFVGPAQPQTGQPAASEPITPPAASAPASQAPAEVAPPPPPSGPAPITGTADLTGKAGSDVASATSIAIGSTITSSVDTNTKPKDVYSVALSSGVPYRFFLQSPTLARSPTVYVSLLNPDSSQATSGLGAPGCAWSGHTDCGFTPTTSDTYYLVVTAGSTGNRYSFTSTSPSTPAATPPITGSSDLTNKAASDTPGTAIAVGASIASEVDSNTKYRDVYSVALTTGTTYHFTFKSPGKSASPTVYVSLLNPDSSQATSGLAAPGCAWSGKNDCTFTLITTDTYYLVVTAGSTGDRYSFSINQ
jgi:hypothetical protein